MTWFESARRAELNNINDRVITQKKCEVMAITNFRPIQFVLGVSPRPTGPPNTICLCQIFVGKNLTKKLKFFRIFQKRFLIAWMERARRAGLENILFCVMTRKKCFEKAKLLFCVFL